MRSSILSLLASALTLVGAEASGASETEKDAVQSTIFNNQTVPPLVELTPSNWADEVKKSKWLLVKHFRYDATCCSAFLIIMN